MPSQAEHNVNDKSELLSLINKYPDGIAANDLKDAYPNVTEDLQVGHRFNLVLETKSKGFYIVFVLFSGLESFGRHLVAIKLTRGHCVPK